jgi:hypothetical protein
MIQLPLVSSAIHRASSRKGAPGIARVGDGDDGGAVEVAVPVVVAAATVVVIVGPGGV